MARRPGGERGGAVELDAEPRARARQERAVRDLWDAGEERRGRVRDERQLADPEVRAGEVDSRAAAVATTPSGLCVAIMTWCASHHPAILRSSVNPPAMQMSARQ